MVPWDLPIRKLTLPIILPIGQVPTGLMPIKPLQHILVPAVLPISKPTLPFNLPMGSGVMVNARTLRTPVGGGKGGGDIAEFPTWSDDAGVSVTWCPKGQQVQQQRGDSQDETSLGVPVTVGATFAQLVTRQDSMQVPVGRQHMGTSKPEETSSRSLPEGGQCIMKLDAIGPHVIDPGFMQHSQLNVTTDATGGHNSISRHKRYGQLHIQHCLALSMGLPERGGLNQRGHTSPFLRHLLGLLQLRGELQVLSFELGGLSLDLCKLGLEMFDSGSFCRSCC
ncbi:MAG: hypothetical protein FRX49_08361 [Trebouxia sp. A1-2]|nr:MAG: hypothetical protein FRX49_08361 [Trebouxia sp. A1-2]